MSETPKHMKSRTVRDEWKAVLAAVEAGQEIVVERYNQPIARIIPYVEASMSHCFTCGDRTEDNAEFCSPACFYTGEAELDVPLAGESTAEALNRKTEDQ
jgi:antitoxin (DNA-binding transcriptional repressor) of toxin-antitoxin stability system